MRAGADLRLLRAAVFAAACATLAATGHLGAAGSGIPPATLALGWGAAFAVALPLAGRERRSVPALAGTLVAAQLALHVLYCVGGHAPAAAPGPRELAARLLCDNGGITLTDAEAAHLVAASGIGDAHAVGARHLADAGGAMGLGEALASLASAPMLLGHLAAALLAGWLLRRGEAALWAAVRLAALPEDNGRGGAFLLAQLPPLCRALRLLRFLCGAPLPGHAAHRGALRTAFLPLPALHGAVLASAVLRRGPPAPAHQLTLAA
ncbi:hypothetical protein [Streptomyces radicis]|uniref:Integral membrane protein n=1 Tax=Streptomyces radicis TaxID=1750517 RepID=A0A3A9W3A5_9ACTN|nr:hypothetical protein [Streptomyces radicis]RKN07232.1 hypothetical protein D7319_19335 [Streptomyces radicis]RKN26750.1 hypothetical protein D7318_05215 [Streptomyces radicis]